MIRFLALFLIFWSVPSYAQESLKPANSAVVSAHPIATKVGGDILGGGGNAFDAAVAVSATLGVVEPFGSGLGGGGFWLIYDAKADDFMVIDARETAPAAAHKDMYLDEQGDVIKGASRQGALSAAIPGLPAALVSVNDHFGSMALPDVLAPSIEYARDGFAIDARYINGATYKKDSLLENDEAASIFLDEGQVPKEGWVLKQPDLAQTLSLIAKHGDHGFYGGENAQKMVDDVHANGGIWTLGDLNNYFAYNREAVIFNYKGARIIAPSLPSSGGLVLANAFNILSGYDLDALSDLDRKHVSVEAMRHAYHNRARYMGDEDFIGVPSGPIISSEMAAQQRTMISMDKAKPSADLEMSVAPDTAPKGTETTHFSVIDEQGNFVAVTQSINFWFGAAFVPKGTGVLLNNEMDDFVIKAGEANGYGLVGTHANGIAPNKRPLSSMSPVFVETDRGVLMVGTPGGSRIISMNMLAIMAYLDGASAQDIVTAPRFHHQFMPDELLYEAGALTEEEITGLKAKGHILRQSSRQYGNMQVIEWDYKTNKVITASDPRGAGAGRVY